MRKEGGADYKRPHCEADKDTVLCGISDMGKLGGMFEWENNLIPLRGCVLTPT